MGPVNRTSASGLDARDRDHGFPFGDDEGNEGVAIRRFLEHYVVPMQARPPIGSNLMLHSSLNPTLLILAGDVAHQTLINQCFAYHTYMKDDPLALLQSLRDSSARTRAGDGAGLAAWSRVGKMLHDAGIL